MLKELWSPEQSSGRIKHESSEASVCPETIYQYIYSPQGRESELYQYLEKARKKRRRQYSRKHRGYVVPASNIIHNHLKRLRIFSRAPLQHRAA